MESLLLRTDAYGGHIFSHSRCVPLQEIRLTLKRCRGTKPSSQTSRESTVPVAQKANQSKCYTYEDTSWLLMYFRADASFFHFLTKSYFGCCGIKAYLIVIFLSDVLNTLIFVARNMKVICL